MKDETNAWLNYAVENLAVAEAPKKGGEPAEIEMSGNEWGFL